MDIIGSINTRKDSDNSILKCRYIVAFLEFFAFFEINVYRLATSLSVVAMVNNTAFTSEKLGNTNTISCPLNYSDEADYNEAAIDGEFSWSPTIQGYVLGSSYLGFVLTLIPGGILAEIYGGKIIALLGLFLSTACHLLSPLTAWTNVYLMISVQFLRGLGQGLIPAALGLLSANWFPKSERGFLNSSVFLGYSFGTVISGFSSGIMCASALFGGWPSVYYIYGILGLVFCLCFHIFMYESPMCHPRISNAELDFILKDQESDISAKRPATPWKSMLTSVPVYAMTYAIFGIYWATGHFLTVHPIFLETILHFSIKDNGYFASYPFVFQVIITFTTSWISKWMNTHNYVGIDKVRKGSHFIYCLLHSLCMLGVYYAGCHRVQSGVIFVAAMSLSGLAFNGSMITPFDMAPTFAGTLMGFSCTIGSLACFILPVLVGFMTDEEQTIEQWNKIFFINIGIIMSSGIIFCAFGSAEVQRWNYPIIECPEKTRSNKSNYKGHVQEMESTGSGSPLRKPSLPMQL